VRVSPALSRVMNGVLVHLVRNCIAHGIELPARRRALGKEETGLIQIVATVGASGPVIVVEDDGGGLDQRRIAERARLLGLDESVAASELVFSSGLSTADAGGDLAGRGVGLSAARAELADVGYSIEVESGDGEFTRFVIHPNLDDA